jgi:hypothetical protein
MYDTSDVSSSRPLEPAHEDTVPPTFARNAPLRPGSRQGVFRIIKVPIQKPGDALPPIGCAGYRAPEPSRRMTTVGMPGATGET